MDGTFLGYIEMTSQLFLCPLGFDGVLGMRRFGTKTQTSCKISLQDLKYGSNSIRLPQNANMFYELYLEDDNGKLANVPVLVRNYRAADGSMPNKDGSIIKDSWVLTRRFFVFDTISGIAQGTGYSDGKVPPEIVRWASSIQLKTMLDPDEQQEITRPYLIIEY